MTQNLVSTDTAGRLIFSILTSFPELSVLTSEELGIRMAVGVVREFSEPDAPRDEVYAVVQAALKKAADAADKFEKAQNKNTGPQWLGEQAGVRD